MPVRTLAALPLMFALLGLVACSSADRRGDIFGSGTDDLELGVAPTGRIGVTGTARMPATIQAPVPTPGVVPAPAPVTPAAVPAPAPAFEATAPVPGTFQTPSSGTFRAQPTYPAPAPEGFAQSGFAQSGFWDQHADAPAPPAETPAAEIIIESPVDPPSVAVPAPPPGAEYAPVPAPRYDARAVPGCGPCNTPACDACTRKDCNPCGLETYVGGFVGVMPGIGGGVEWLREFRRTKSMSLFWDVSLSYQDLWDEFSDESLTGKYNNFRVGVMARFMPCARLHPTARAGITWFRADGNPQAIDFADFESGGDFIGGYVAIGLDYDITNCFTTGIEIGYNGGVEPGNGEFGGTPEARLHFLFKF